LWIAILQTTTAYPATIVSIHPLPLLGKAHPLHRKLRNRPRYQCHHNPQSPPLSPVINSQEILRGWQNINPGLLLNFTFDQIQETGDDELLEFWSTLRHQQTIQITGSIKPNSIRKLDTESDIRQLFYELCTVDPTAKNIIDLDTISYNKETNLIYVDIIGDEILEKFCATFGTHYINWTSASKDNEVISSGAPVFGPISLNKYTKEHLRDSIKKEFGDYVETAIQYISSKENVTTIFFQDPQIAILVTSKAFVIAGNLDSKNHFVKFAMIKKHKDKIPQVRIRGLKRKPEAAILLTLINRKCATEIGKTIQVLEVAKNAQQKFLGYVTVYIPVGVQTITVANSINGKTLLGTKVSATSIKDPNG